MSGFVVSDLFLQDYISVRFRVEYVLPLVLNQPISFQRQVWKTSRKSWELSDWDSWSMPGLCVK